MRYSDKNTGNGEQLVVPAQFMGQPAIQTSKRAQLGDLPETQPFPFSWLCS